MLARDAPEPYDGEPWASRRVRVSSSVSACHMGADVVFDLLYWVFGFLSGVLAGKFVIPPIVDVARSRAR